MNFPPLSATRPLPLKPPDPVHANVQSHTEREPRPTSYASAASNPRLTPRFQPIELQSRQYSLVDGKPSVHFSTAEFDAGAALFRHSLVAKFTLGRPTIEEIRQVFKGTWQIKGRATVSDIWDSRHLMIILDSEKDAKVALTSPLRKVGHAMFRLFRYSPDYNPKRESTTTTKWVRLPGIHPAFVTKNFVASIVNSFGYFLDLDERSKACSTLKYARACIEMDVSKPIPDEVRISLSDGRIFWQKFEVEGGLSYCSHCKLHGHILDECRKKKPATNDQVKAKNTSSAGVLKSIAVTIDKVPDTNGSKSKHHSQEEWIEVRRNKGHKAVKSDTGNTKTPGVVGHMQESVVTAVIQQDASLVMDIEALVNNEVEESDSKGRTNDEALNGGDEGPSLVMVVYSDQADNEGHGVGNIDVPAGILVPGGIDGSASSKEHNKDMQSSDFQSPEELTGTNTEVVTDPTDTIVHNVVPGEFDGSE